MSVDVTLVQCCGSLSLPSLTLDDFKSACCCCFPCCKVAPKVAELPLLVMGQSELDPVLVLDEDKLAQTTFHTFIKHKDKVKFIVSSGPDLPNFEHIVGKQLDDLFPNRNESNFAFWNMIYMSALNGEVGHQLIQYTHLLLSVQTFTIRNPHNPELIMAGFASIAPLTVSAMHQLQSQGPDHQSM